MEGTNLFAPLLEGVRTQATFKVVFPDLASLEHFVRLPYRGDGWYHVDGWWWMIFRRKTVNPTKYRGYRGHCWINCFPNIADIGADHDAPLRGSQGVPLHAHTPSHLKRVLFSKQAS